MITRGRLAVSALAGLAISGMAPSARAQNFQLSCVGPNFNVALIVTVNEDSRTVTSAFEGSSSGSGPFPAEIDRQYIKWSANGSEHSINRVSGHYIDREPGGGTYQWDRKLIDPNAKPKF